MEFTVLQITSSVKTNLGVTGLWDSFAGCWSFNSNCTLSETVGPVWCTGSPQAAVLSHGSRYHHSASALNRQILCSVFCSETFTCLSESTHIATEHCTKQTHEEQRRGGPAKLSRLQDLFFFLCVSQHSITVASRQHRWLQAVSSSPKQEKTRVTRCYIWVSLPFLCALSKLCMFFVYLPPCFDRVVHDPLLSFATCPLLPGVGEKGEGRALLLRRWSH